MPIICERPQNPAFARQFDDKNSAMIHAEKLAEIFTDTDFYVFPFDKNSAHIKTHFVWHAGTLVHPSARRNDYTVEDIRNGNCGMINTYIRELLDDGKRLSSILTAEGVDQEKSGLQFKISTHVQEIAGEYGLSENDLRAIYDYLYGMCGEIPYLGNAMLMVPKFRKFASTEQH